jgi:hypothetical protein
MHQSPPRLVRKRSPSGAATPDSTSQPWQPLASSAPPSPSGQRRIFPDATGWDQLTQMVYNAETPILVRHNLAHADELPSNFQRLGDLLLVYPTDTESHNPNCDCAALLDSLY